MNNSLWGNDFIVEPTIDKQKKILKKIDNPKKIKDSTKILKSKITSIEEKLSLIQTEVNKILGVYKNDTIVIKTKSELIEYINKAIISKEKLSETAINSFNRTFKNLYYGSKDGFFMSQFIDEVIKSNEENPDHIITVNYNGVETSNPNELRNMKKQFENRTTYEIFYEYDANGLINKANVTRQKVSLKIEG